MPVTFQVSADNSTELVLNIQSTLYRYPNYVKELKSFFNLTNDNKEEIQDVDNDLHPLLNSFFHPNLTNGTLKERQEDPLFFHCMEHGNQSCRKKVNIITKKGLLLHFKVDVDSRTDLLLSYSSPPVCLRNKVDSRMGNSFSDSFPSSY